MYVHIHLGYIVPNVELRLSLLPRYLGTFVVKKMYVVSPSITYLCTNVGNVCTYFKWNRM
jgi:hypothetical protein